MGDGLSGRSEKNWKVFFSQHYLSGCGNPIVLKRWNRSIGVPKWRLGTTTTWIFFSKCQKYLVSLIFVAPLQSKLFPIFAIACRQTCHKWQFFCIVVNQFYLHRKYRHVSSRGSWLLYVVPRYTQKMYPTRPRGPVTNTNCTSYRHLAS
jgi:hypothetical protein